MTIAAPEPPALPRVPRADRISLLSISGMLLLALLWGLSIPITKIGLEAILTVNKQRAT